MSEYLYVRLKRPEGYEGIDSSLIVEDLDIGEEFEPMDATEEVLAERRRLSVLLDALSQTVLDAEVRELVDEIARERDVAQ